MGSGSSRQHSAAGLKRRLSTLVCGSPSTSQNEDSVSSSSQGNKSTHRGAECGCLSERSTSTHEGLLFENVQTNVGRATSNESVSVDNLNAEGGSSHPTHSATAITSFSEESSSTQGVDDLVNHDYPESSVGSTSSVIRVDRADIQGNSDAETGVINSSSIVSSGAFSPDASGNGNGTNTQEARRSVRRMLSDAFSRGRTEFQTNDPLPTDDVDTIESRWSWLIEFGDDRRRSRRSLFGGERRRRPRSPLWERLFEGGGARGGRTACRSGLHPDGQCLCGLQGGASGRTRMSRIVVLADVLFEVLDELQRQPTALDQPMISNPAPKSAIDSLPIKFYEKPAAFESGDGAEKCYICLEEYKTGDEVRVLPCTHGYHPTCVDKWLKEIHGICPLCRGDVRTVPVDHA